MNVTTLELAGIVMASVTLAATDASALSRLGVAWLSKKLGVKPGEIRSYESATDGEKKKKE